MGIDYEHYLLFGWVVEYEVINKYLIELQIGTCDGDYIIDKNGEKSINGYQCFCGNYCFDNTKLPDGIYIIKSSPSYDCDYEYCEYTISLIRETKMFDLNDLDGLKNIAITDEIKKLLDDLKINGEPKLFSKLNVW